MRIKVQVINHDVPISEHMLMIDDDYIFEVPGGILDEESGRRLLGYSLKGIWAKKKAEGMGSPWVTDTARREEPQRTPFNPPQAKSLKSLKSVLLEVVDIIDQLV